MAEREDNRIKFCSLCGGVITNDVENLQRIVNTLVQDNIVPPVEVTSDNIKDVQDIVIEAMKRIGIFLWHDDPILTVGGIARDDYKDYIGVTRIHQKHWKEIQEARTHEEEEIKDYYEFTDEEFPLTEFSSVIDEDDREKRFRVYRSHVKEIRDSIINTTPYRNTALERLAGIDYMDFFYWLNHYNDGTRIGSTIDPPELQSQENWTDIDLTSDEVFPKGRPKFRIKARHLEEFRRHKRGVWNQISWATEDEEGNPTSTVSKTQTGGFGGYFPERVLSSYKNAWTGTYIVYPSFPYNNLFGDDSFDFTHYELYSGLDYPPSLIPEVPTPVVYGTYEGSGTGSASITKDSISATANFSQKASGDEQALVHEAYYANGTEPTPHHWNIYPGKYYYSRFSIFCYPFPKKLVPINKGSKLKLKYTSSFDTFRSEVVPTGLTGERRVILGGYVTIGFTARPLVRHDDAIWFNYYGTVVTNSISSELLGEAPFTYMSTIPGTSGDEYYEVDLWELISKTPTLREEMEKYYDGTWDTRGVYLDNVSISFRVSLSTTQLNPEFNEDSPNYDSHGTRYEEGLDPFEYSTYGSFSLSAIKIVTNNILDDEYEIELT